MHRHRLRTCTLLRVRLVVLKCSNRTFPPSLALAPSLRSRKRDVERHRSCTLVPCETNHHRHKEVRPPPRNRVVTVKGTALNRGRQLWSALGADASVLANKRRGFYSVEGLSCWEALGVNCKPAWARYAPVSWMELQGMVANGAAMADLLLLGTDFEMQMAAWRDSALYAPIGALEGGPERGRCTAFAVTDAVCGPVCGQNVDEEASGWDGGASDVVVRILSADPATTPHALVYTHPGVPAYCGMNSAGLCVLNLYIDQHSPQAPEEPTRPGVPINVAIRELLTHRTVEEASAWVEGLPRTAYPTTYLMMQGEAVACVEASAQRVATLWLRGNADMCHSNHPILDQRMQAGNGGVARGSKFRLDTIRQLVQAARQRNGLTIEEAQLILMACPPADPKSAPTMASVVMDPSHSRMHIRFRGDGVWLEVPVTGGSNRFSDVSMQSDNGMGVATHV